MKFGAGQSVRRTEDIRFITGNGQYTDDLSFPRQAYAAFVRSPYAHAKINGIDVSAARSAPGVVAVLTQADIVAAGGCNMPSHTPMKGRDGSAPKGVDKPLLADAQVTFSGEAVAMVIAETLAEARDAAELVAVDYED
jgi:carbon-monoxide dehydrogenase large subunit